MPLPGKPAFIGLMSGTSLDAVDGVLARFAPNSGAAGESSNGGECETRCQTLGTASRAIPPTLREALRALASGRYDQLSTAQWHEALPELPAGPTDPIEACALATKALTDLYLAVVEDLRLASPDTSICAVGAHGQTIRHRPEAGYTLQIFNGARLAALSGLPCICDFRSGDVALGGQGAPLVPLFHQQVLAKPGQLRLILNLGGIANLSILSPGGTLGFDTGPASTLLDAWCYRHRGEAYDRDGAWAASGTVDDELLRIFLSEPYFAQTPPKSTGRELFSMTWLEACIARRLQSGPPEQPSLRPEDIQATISMLSAQSVADAVRQALQQHAGGLAGSPQWVHACGGGVYNKTLMRDIQNALNQKQAMLLGTTADLGDEAERPADMAPAGNNTSLPAAHSIDPQSMEASAFAWLAWKRWEEEALDYRAITGSTRPTVMGALYLP